MANISSNMVNKFEAEVVTANMNVSSMIDDAMQWIAYNLEPEDVFSQSDLEKWAEANGYTKETQ